MPTTTFTGSSGSGRVRVYQESQGPSSRSASIHSPATSETPSFSSSNDSDEWTHLGPPSDDGIEPSDSASRSRHPGRSRRHTTEARPAPTRRHSSRRVVVEHDLEREALPRHHTSHRHRSSRTHREAPRRAPSDESSSTVASADDYPYSHHGGMPPPRAYPPSSSGYRHVNGAPPHSHGGYPPSMTSAPGYNDPFQAGQALVHMPQHDAFGYPSNNPFSPGTGPQQNPFSPMDAPGTPGYFGQGAPMPPPTHQQRPPGPGRPSSMYAPSSAGYGSEMMPSPYQHPGMPGMPGIPGMQGMQGMPGMMPGMPPSMQGMYPGYGMPGYPQYPYQYPPSHTSSPAPPAPKEKTPEPKPEPKVEKKDETVTKEMEALRELIKKHEEERVAREIAAIKKAEAEAAAAAEKAAREAAEKKKAEEIAAASAAAKAEAEKAAEEAAKKAKEEHDKALAESEKAKEAAEKKKKELEEEIKKNKPTPDSLKAPIKFKDAVGRKFSFPWHLCKTWKGMEGLIRQAFLHVDMIGQHVQEGHYDLTGPDGEIILPQVWDTMIKPDWEVSMHMWPMPEPPKKEDKLAHEAAGMDGLPDPFAGMGLTELMALSGEPPKPPKKGDKKGSSGKNKAKRSSTIIDVPPPPPHHGGGGPMPPPPPPANFPPGFAEIMNFGPADVTAVPDAPKTSRTKSGSRSKSKEVSGFAAWMAGGRPAKKDDEKYVLVKKRSNGNGNGGGGGAAATAVHVPRPASVHSASASTTSHKAEQAACVVM